MEDQLERHFQVGDIVYFGVRRNTTFVSENQKVSRIGEIEHRIVGLIEHIEKSDLGHPRWFEIRRAEESPAPYTLENLPEKYKPLVATQSPTSADVFRVRKEDVFEIIPEDFPQEQVQFETLRPTSVGNLAKATLTDHRGKLKSVFGRVIDDWAGKDILVIACSGIIPKAFSEYIRTENGRKILRQTTGNEPFSIRTSSISELERSNFEHYQKEFLLMLAVHEARFLNEFQRERISAVNSEPDKLIPEFYCFTYDNSFVSCSSHIPFEIITEPRKDFLAFKPKEEARFALEVPKMKSIVYGRVLAGNKAGRNKHGRNKLQWFSASEYPGLDAFLGFIRGKIPQEKRSLDMTRDSDGKRTVFTDLLEGYFNPRASNPAMTWFRSEYLWMYTL